MRAIKTELNTIPISKIKDKTIKSAYKYLKKMNKTPYIFANDGKYKDPLYRIRVHHKDYYFDYAPITGKWCRTDKNNRSWWWSKDVEDFYSRMDGYVEYVRKLKKGDVNEMLNTST